MIRSRPSGTLSLPPPRELIAAQSLLAAYEPSGDVAKDTVRPIGEDGTASSYRGPDRFPGLDIVEVCDEPVVWAGETRPHYGHFMTESVARLWPLLPGGVLEGLPAVFVAPHGFKGSPEWFDAFGLDRMPLPSDGAVRFTRMHVPEPAMRIRGWMAPEMRQVHLWARRGLRVPTLTRRSKVLWLSRSNLTESKRRAYDESLLAWALDNFISVLNPEMKSLPEQVAEIEAADTVAGVIGSAFHTMLMAEDVPHPVYISPRAIGPSGRPSNLLLNYMAQGHVLNTNGSFVQTCAETGADVHRCSSGQQANARAPYHVLIPETLRALDAVAIPGLLADPRAAALAYPERLQPSACLPDIEYLAAKMLLNPFSVDARRALGAAFEEEGLERCAREQFAAAARLSQVSAGGIQRNGQQQGPAEEDVVLEWPPAPA